MNEDGGGAARRGVGATRAFVAFSVVMALMMVFPVYALGNRVEPFVLGMPFSLAWVVFWIAVEFLGLVAFFVWEERARGGA